MAASLKWPTPTSFIVIHGILTRRACWRRFRAGLRPTAAFVGVGAGGAPLPTPPVQDALRRSVAIGNFRYHARMSQLSLLIQNPGALLVFGTVLLEQFGLRIPAFPVVVVAGARAMEGGASWQLCLLAV